jgi:hypothetical protein
MANFDADTRPLAEVPPSYMYHHNATGQPLDFRTLACHPVAKDHIDRCMVDSSCASLPIHYGVFGGLMSLALNIMVKTIMVGLVDRILCSTAET